MANAPRDNNRVPVIIGVSSVNLTTPVPIAVNPVTNALIVEIA